MTIEKPVDDLVPHPFRREVFGVGKPSERFISSIESQGGLLEGTEIVINHSNEIIDGTNRWSAFRYLSENRSSGKWDTISCIQVNYPSKEEEKRDILMREDTQNLVFSQKVKAAMAYENEVAEYLIKRQKAGVSVEEMENDPVEEAEDPRVESNAGSKLRSDELAAQYVGWGAYKYRQAKKIWLLKEEGDGKADELVERLDEGDANSVNAVYTELEGRISADSEDHDTDEIADVKQKRQHSITTGSYQFLPVIGKVASGAMTSQAGQRPLKIDGKVATWWEEDGLIENYPYVFVSPFGDQNVPAGQHDWPTAFRYDRDDITAVCDSGGYQLMTESGEKVDSSSEHSFPKGKIHPETMVEWQVRNADIGPILDHPPFAQDRDPSSFNDFVVWRDLVFYPMMDRTAENARRMKDKLVKMRMNGVPGADEFIQLGVLQGRLPRNEARGEYYLIEDWHKRMLNSMGQPEGWALSAKRADNLYHQAAMLSYAASQFEDPAHIHVFQAGSAPHLALLQFFAMRTGWSVTSDATSYLQRGSVAGCVAPPGHPGSSYDLNVRSQHQFNRFPDRCPVCYHANNDGVDVTSGGVRAAHLRSLHNLYHFINFNEYISEQIRSVGRDVFDGVTIGGPNTLRVEDNEFWETMKRHFPTDRKLVDLARAMRSVDLSVEHGHEFNKVRALLRKSAGLINGDNLMMDAMAW